MKREQVGPAYWRVDVEKTLNSCVYIATNGREPTEEEVEREAEEIDDCDWDEAGVYSEESEEITEDECKRYGFMDLRDEPVPFVPAPNQMPLPLE